MEVMVYGERDDEAIFFAAVAKREGIKLKCTHRMLTEDNVEEAKNSIAIVIVTACKITEYIACKLYSYGVKYILTRSTGFDHIDKAAVKKYQLRVANVPIYSHFAVSEYTVMLILNLIRRFPTILQKVERQDFTLEGILGTELNQMKVGIIGTGKIGEQTAKLLKVFGTSILAYTPHPNQQLENILTYVSLNELLSLSDIIVLQCSLNKFTRHLINENNIKKMKKGVFLVNTARGGLMDFEAVLQGLKCKKISGIAVDVYENEKEYFRKDCQEMQIHDPCFSQLIKMPNVIFTPHVAFYTHNAIRNLIQISFQNLNDFIQTGTCENEILLS